ncbi:7-cyano-7-deazaguanine synthase [Cellulomonas sp. 73-92]|uniref:7-cyano-7-deazaguanine synthase n=1 Tax=Cellulomonas sp. 73-92 TaxID=1895740 RepID=UPI00345CE56D
MTVVVGGEPCTVLLSGGIDSAVVAALLLEGGWRASALWIDIGQPAATSERAASVEIAEYLGIVWRPCSARGIQVPASGEIPGRNDLLVGIGMAAAPRESVAIGIHAGTPYSDNSPGWLSAWNALADTQYGGSARLLAPLVEMYKTDVIGLARDLSIPLAITYSCEASNRPCGVCASCQDRAGAGIDN